MKTIKFDSIEDYENYLSEIFPHLAQDREYNIFMHCVTSRTSYFVERSKTPDEDVRKKVESIMKRGLNLDGTQDYGNYGSINGTAKFYGNSRDVDVKNISEYDYFSGTDNVHSIIIAIPKYIQVYGEKVEFSSYNGSMKHASQHVKDCLFDLIKGYYLPLEFIFAHQIVNKKTGEVTLNLNEKHLSIISDDDKDELLREMTEKSEQVLEYCKSKYNVSNYEDIFKSMTDEHMDAIDDYLNEP